MTNKEKFNQNMKAEIISDEDADKVNGGWMGETVEIFDDNGKWYISSVDFGRNKEETYSSREEAINAAKLEGYIIRRMVWTYDKCRMPVYDYEYDTSGYDDLERKLHLFGQNDK